MNKTTWIYVIGGVILLGLIALVSFSRDSGGDSDTGMALSDTEHIKGSQAAAVTIIEYSDFQCPACKAYAPVVKQMAEQFGNRIAIAYRHFPLVSINANALEAARASEAASIQGKFWEYHDKLFEEQSSWSAADNPRPYFEQYARDLGLSLGQFGIDMDSEQVRNKVKTDRDAGNDAGVNSTPSFFLNGEKIQPSTPDQFAAFIEAALANAPVPDVAGDDLASRADVHEHADFAVYLGGKKVDFSQEKYQSDSPADEAATDGHDHNEEGGQHDPYVHVHDGNGDVVHKHKEGVTLRYFFQSLGMDFTKDCFEMDTGEKYCGGEGNSLKFFVNGKRNQEAGAYILSDGDQILISHGPLADPDLQTQLDSVSDRACIFSETCPERGSPPEEKCVGGLGTNCVE